MQHERRTSSFSSLPKRISYTANAVVRSCNDDDDDNNGDDDDDDDDDGLG